MPKRFTGKLCRFLFEHLDEGTFGEQLLWLDRRAGVFQLLWKHGNGGTTVPYRDCAVFMAWDECKRRRHRCKPLEAKQRFRAAMAKMRLQILKAWGAHEPGKGFQIRRFPKADLDYLLRNGQKTRGARRSRHASVYSDSLSQTDSSDDTATEGPSTKLPNGMKPVKVGQDTTWDMAQLEKSKLAALATVPEKFLASPQGDKLAEEVNEDDYPEDFAIDFAGESDSINGSHNSNEELVICKCSREDPQAPRCLWCIVLEYSDPPINPVFRFDVTVPPGTVLIV